MSAQKDGLERTAAHQVGHYQGCIQDLELGGQIKLPKILGGGATQYGRYNIGLQRLEGYYRWQCYVWGGGIIQ